VRKHIGTIEPGTELGDVGLHRLKACFYQIRQGKFWPGSEDLHLNRHRPTHRLAQAAQNTAAEAAGTTTELDHSIMRSDRQVIQESLGHLGEMRILISSRRAAVVD